MPNISLPTRVTVESGALIDNFYTRSVDIPKSLVLEQTEVSDHFPIFIVRNLSTVNKPIGLDKKANITQQIILAQK